MATIAGKTTCGNKRATVKNGSFMKTNDHLIKKESSIGMTVA
ncbi:hypothetical protein QWZ16_17475 [Vibrio ostreicida]|uniref:Uncharacterized protein n=1 Tax=Vibrio ostreicida TaxID=526588 RepID=A0ABT8BZ96_9VIBR|nr:hypothetical protein [Vibrio ostreicida]MDN3611395.1 hypothetical protein [Vibrio ostreicida]